MKTGRLWSLILVLIWVIVTGTACSQEKASEGKPIAKVGENLITERMFRENVAEWAYYEGLGSVSFDDRRKFLDQTIDRELLIQEAIRLGLHKEASFRRSIEKYWEQSLITALLQRQVENLKGSIIVTSEEVEQRYQEMAKTDKNLPPLKEVSKQIEEQIREDKQSESLEKWIDGLRDKIDINVYEENLRSLR